MGPPGAHIICARTYTQVTAGAVIRWWPAGADRHTILQKSKQVAAGCHTVRLKRDGTAVACGKELVASGKARGMTANVIRLNAAISAREKGFPSYPRPPLPPPPPPPPHPYWINRLLTLTAIPTPTSSSITPTCVEQPTLHDLCEQVTSHHTQITRVLKQRLRDPPFPLPPPTPPPPPSPSPFFPSSSYASALSPPPGLHLPAPLSCTLPPNLFSTSTPSPDDLPFSSQNMLYPGPPPPKPVCKTLNLCPPPLPSPPFDTSYLPLAPLSFSSCSSPVAIDKYSDNNNNLDDENDDNNSNDEDMGSDNDNNQSGSNNNHDNNTDDTNEDVNGSGDDNLDEDYDCGDDVDHTDDDDLRERAHDKLHELMALILTTSDNTLENLVNITENTPPFHPFEVIYEYFSTTRFKDHYKIIDNRIYHRHQ